MLQATASLKTRGLLCSMGLTPSLDRCSPILQHILINVFQDNWFPLQTLVYYFMHFKILFLGGGRLLLVARGSLAQRRLRNLGLQGYTMQPGVES